MKKIATVIGARPQIIKASALSRAIKTKFSSKLTELIIHTGQHYDENMSGLFFKELNIPKPHYNLNVGSGNQGKQTAQMITGMEEILLNEKPDILVVYGDTNSTLAGALVASKIQIPIVHIEAGLRSFNKTMPEEINRIVCDHVSTLLFSPTKAGYVNLLAEGFKSNTVSPYSFNNPKIYHTGDIMFDNSCYFSAISDKKSTLIADFNLKKEPFILCTVHRNNNTDNPERLTAIFDALNQLTNIHNLSVVLPLHPRTKKRLPQHILSKNKTNKKLKIIEPVSFLDMIALEKNAELIITDSGGVQKEACFFKKPCVVLRAETEWVELVESGVAKLVDANKENLLNAVSFFIKNNNSLIFPSLFGDGKTAEFICEELCKL